MPGKPPVGQKGIGSDRPPGVPAPPLAISSAGLAFALFGAAFAGFGLGFLAYAALAAQGLLT